MPATRAVSGIRNSEESLKITCHGGFLDWPCERLLAADSGSNLHHGDPWLAYKNPRPPVPFVASGHGSDEFNCAEFCPTSHHFLVNGKEVLVNFTEAGTQWGCTKHVSAKLTDSLLPDISSLSLHYLLY